MCGAGAAEVKIPGNAASVPAGLAAMQMGLSDEGWNPAFRTGRLNLGPGLHKWNGSLEVRGQHVVLRADLMIRAENPGRLDDLGRLDGTRMTGGRVAMLPLSDS